MAARQDELIAWTGSPSAGLRRAIREFERRTGVHVTAATIPPPLIMDPTRLMAAIAGGSPPDAVFLDRFTIGQWASRDALLPLDAYVADSPEIDPKNFFEACWDEATYGGHVYALPWTTDDRALYYNKDMLSRAGLVDARGQPRPPRTWAELRKYASRLTVTDSSDRLVRVGFVPNYGNSWLYLYSWQNGGQFMSEDGTRCTMNAAPNVEALEFMVSIYDDLGGVKKVDQFATAFQGAENDPFYVGQVAMKIDGNWVLNAVAEFAPQLNFGVAPAPVPEGRPFITWSGGHCWAIPRGAAHPDLAWKFVEWLCSDEGLLLTANSDRRYLLSRGKPYIPNMTARRDVNEELFRLYVKGNPDLGVRFVQAYRSFMDLMEVSRYRPVTPVGLLLWNEHVRAWDLATHHVYTPKEALDRGTEMIQRELDGVLHPAPARPVPWGVLFGLAGALIAALLLLMAWAIWRRGGFLRKEALAGYLFSGPWLIGFLLLILGPILASIVLSFCRYDVIHPAEWVGLGNFRQLLALRAEGGSALKLSAQDPLFWKSLWNTLFMMLGIPLGMTASLSVAMLLNLRVRGQAFYRTIYYLPAIVPAVANALLWIWVLNPTNGLINAILEALGIRWHPPWLTDPGWSKPAMIVMGLWGAGAGMILWLAGLKGIPEHLYEAALVDGAGPWVRFRHVTLPMLSPYIFFNLIMGVIGTLQIFETAYIMTQGGPVDSTLFYVYYLFNQAFRYFHMGMASAQAWLLFLIILGLTLIQLRLAKRWVYYEGG